MRRTRLTLILICLTTQAFASVTDSLLAVLDKTIQQRNYYTERKQQTIEVAKKKLALAQSTDELFLRNQEIAGMYLGFQFDSAYAYSRKCLNIAYLLPEEECRQEANILHANILSSAGLFLEAKETLDSIHTPIPKLSFSFHSARERLYANLCDYHETSPLAKSYDDLLKKEYLEAFQALQANSPLHYLYMYRSFELSQQWEKALKASREYAALTDVGTQPHAVAFSCMAEAYHHLGYKEKRKEYLIQSVMSDIISATRENCSMLQLAILLYEEKDVERAYRYIKIALDDANLYNARFRNLQVSRTLPIIEDAYQRSTTTYKLCLWITIALVSALCLCLSGIVLKLRAKKRKIGLLQQQLVKQNHELKHLAGEQNKLILLQSSLNKEVESRNKELSIMTTKYKEINHVREEYLGHFLQMCSDYISKLNDYRKTINRKLLAGQYQELITFTSSSKFIATEKDALYQQFDSAFLRLYPGFVQQLNNLLLPEEQLEFKNGEALNKELRICALLRLGIADSSRIAEFLGYTPSTVYTYRTKMRNRAKDRDNFEANIQRIAQSSE